MKRVKMLTTLADAQRVAHPGAVIEVDDTEAADLIGGGYAEAVDSPADEASAESVAEPVKKTK